MQKEKLVSSLNSKNRIFRHRILKKLRKEIKEIESSDKTSLCLRSTYSFSSYSPSMLAYLGYKNGLGLAGILDTETVEGAKEFLKGCKLFSIHGLVSADLRVKPHIADENISICGITGINCGNLKTVSRFLKPYREKHKEQVIGMVTELNKKLNAYKIRLSFLKDVFPLTKSLSGGTVTDRHVWLACSKKMISLFGKGDKLIKSLQKLGMAFSEEEIMLLTDFDNYFYEFDFARILKQKFKLGIKVTPYYKDVIKFANEINAISFYELRNSVSGNEEKIVGQVKDCGYDALAFNPRKICEEERKTLIELCFKNQIIAIPLEVIDFPRKKFDTVLTKQEFEILNKNAWAVKGHEKSVEKGGKGFKELGDVDFERKIDILAGLAHPKYYEKQGE